VFQTAFEEISGGVREAVLDREESLRSKITARFREYQINQTSVPLSDPLAPHAVLVRSRRAPPRSVTRLP
jgi:hypothetical protein